MKMSACVQRNSGRTCLSARADCGSPVPGRHGSDTARAGEATEAMKGTIEEVLRILADKDLKQPARRTSAGNYWKRWWESALIIQEMSRRSMGAPWANLSDKEKQEFVSLFQTLLVNTYADKVESYSGEGVQYVNERTEKEYAEVRTKVLTGKTEIPLDYRLLNKGSDLACLRRGRGRRQSRE